MTHRLLVLFLSGVMAFGATTVRADRKISARAPLAGDVHWNDPIPWEILAGCPETIGPSTSYPEKKARRRANAATTLTGDELARRINRLHDGLNDMPFSPLDGDAIAQRINHRNEGLALRPAKSVSVHADVVDPRPHGGLADGLVEVSRVAVVSKSPREPQATCDSPGACSDEPVQNARSCFDGVLQEESDRAIAVRPSPALLHVTRALMAGSALQTGFEGILQPQDGLTEVENSTDPLWSSLCCEGFDAAGSSSETNESAESLVGVERFVSCMDYPQPAVRSTKDDRTPSETSPTAAAIAASKRQPFNEAHSASELFEDDVYYGCELAAESLAREIDPMEHIGSIHENAELQWEFYETDACGVQDLPIPATADQPPTASAVSQRDDEEGDHRGVTYSALSELAAAVTQPIDQAAAHVAASASRTLHGALQAAYRPWYSRSIRAARRPVPYIGL